LTTIFTPPYFCDDKVFAIAPPTASPQQDVIAIYEGGKCKPKNECLPWHDRPNYGFFSPAFNCPAGWTPQLTMADGQYFSGIVVVTASSLQRVFPISTMLPSETAVVCCPPCVFPKSFVPFTYRNH
jgi:hypothetical protein